VTRLVVVALCALLGMQTAAADQRFDKLLRTGERCYEELNYGCAISRLTDAGKRAADKGLTPAPKDALRLHQTLAFALASVEKHDLAAAQFEKCFAVQPMYRLDPKIISPKIYADYKRARHKTIYAMLKGARRAPGLPGVIDVPPPTMNDLSVHVPSDVVLGGRLEPEQALNNVLDLAIGGHLLFDDDGEDFSTGFGVAMSYMRVLSERFQVGAVGFFAQHNYAQADLKAGFPGTLYVLNAAASARLTLQFGEYIDMGIGAFGGIALAGLGGVGDTVGGWVGADVRLTALITREFGVGLSVMPQAVIASVSDDDTGTSFTLPVLLRFETRF